MLSLKTILVASMVPLAQAVLRATESSSQLVLENDKLSLAISKSNGQVTQLRLEKQDLLGSAGSGPYVDCHCVPSSGNGFWAPGSGPARRFQLIKGVDSNGTAYGGVRMGDTYPQTNQTIEQWWFLRDGETGLHMFTRVTYFNASRPFLRGLGELRTLFRPSGRLFTHLSGSKENWAPIPSPEAVRGGQTVGDATTFLGRTPQDAYASQYSDYFSKYSFAEQWRSHDTHGQFADGRFSSDGSAYGAWLVHNTRETYYGGPLHSDLVVDGIVYNYIVSGHHGAPVPNMTHGFDRTFGPQFYYFNKGPAGTALTDLRADAARFAADPGWNAEFYDSIAPHVPNYAPSSRRTTVQGRITLPQGARRPIVVLSENRQDFQLNVFDSRSLQYWAEIDPSTGSFTIPRVVQGTYRVTVYAEGIFGWFILDDVSITLPSPSTLNLGAWTPEGSGTEIFRIGTPDKSAGEFRHGTAPDTSKPLAPAQHRIYWGKYDFPTDFPAGVNYTVGLSDPGRDMNYIHWSFFPGSGNQLRPQPYYANVNNWTIHFSLPPSQLTSATKTATFTLQIAGVKTANGNDRWAGLIPGEKYSNIPYTVAVNGVDIETWIIPYWRSGSCGVRGSVVCQNFGHNFVFNAKERLRAGDNTIVLSLPFNATNAESALLPGGIYVQYDAMRLELE